jgi:ABC-type antimicrobial peptide transport system permease subunit
MAIKNIRFSKLRSLILYFSFTIISITILLFFSLKPFVYDYFYHNIERKYGSTDFILTYDQNSNARYFSIRELEYKFDNEDDFEFLAPFFEVKTLLEAPNDEQFYVNLMASDIEEFKKVITLPDSLTNIKENEVIISKSFSQSHQVKENDWIELQIGEELLPFQVIKIVDDNGLLQKNTVLIDKNSNLHLLLKSMGVNINPKFTKKIYNVVYFSLKDNNNSSDLKSEIKSINDYQNLVIKDTYNFDRIDDLTNRVTSLMFLTFTFILLAILFVLHSTLQAVFRERKTQVGVMRILGGSEKFSFSVILTEILLYLLTAYLTSLFLTNLIVEKGLESVGSTLNYHIDQEAILSSLVILIVVVFLLIIFNNFKIKDVPVVGLSRWSSQYKPKNHKLYFYYLIIQLMFLVLVLNINDIPIQYQSLLKFSLLIGILLTLTRVIMILIIYLLRFKTVKLFNLFFIKNLKDEHAYSAIMNILIIAFCLMVLLVSTNAYIKKHTEDIYSNIPVDYALVNVVHNYDLTELKLNSNDQIENVNQAYLLRDVKVDEINTVFEYSISMDVNYLHHYLDFNLDDTMIERLNDPTTPYVILPDKFQYIDNLKIGDEVTLHLSPTYSNEKFKIAGFVDIGVQDILITNIHRLGYFPPNAFLMNASDDQKALKQDLIKTYSKDLYYVLDFEELMDDTVSQIEEMTVYFSYLIQIVILCFIITIYNNLLFVYLKMKPLYSKMIVLGCSKKRLIMNYLMQNLILISVVSISVLIVFNALAKQIPYLLLFVGTYQNVSFTTLNYLWGISIALCVSFLSFITIIYKINQQTIVEDLKYY